MNTSPIDTGFEEHMNFNDEIKDVYFNYLNKATFEKSQLIEFMIDIAVDLAIDPLEDINVTTDRLWEQFKAAIFNGERMYDHIVNGDIKGEPL
jgi:hypothetical protein